MAARIPLASTVALRNPPALPRSLRPRKTPTQRRAAVTVDVILQAAALVLDAEGLEGFNTNRVARAAGVSVGSLYQYFPGKDALAAALIARAADSLAADIARAAADARGRPLADAVAMLVDVAIRHQFERPRLAAALDYLERQLPVEPVGRAARQAILTHVVEILALHAVEVHGPLTEVAEDLLVLTRAMVDAAAARAAAHDGPTRDRVLRAVLGYLRGADPPAKVRGARARDHADGRPGAPATRRGPAPPIASRKRAARES